MITELAPILILTAGAGLIFGAGRLTRRFPLPESIGTGVALCVIAAVFGVMALRWPTLSNPAPSADRLISYARSVALIGMLFLAGSRFNLSRLRERRDNVLRVALGGALSFAAAIVLVSSLSPQDAGSTVLLAATAVAGSVWFPGQFTQASEKKSPRLTHQLPAVVLALMAVALVYFFDVCQAIPRGRSAVAAYVVVALYEALKLALIIAFGYFICSRFLARAAGRVSQIRTTMGFALIAILIFVLMLIATNQLATMAWAFAAGALWRTSDTGADFIKRERPIASAVLLTVVFLSLVLQSHGRSLRALSILPIILLIVIVLKVAVLWLLRVTGFASSKDATLATAIMFPGEIAILLLGFGVTRWAIDSPAYFTILGYAFVSTFVTPIAQHLAMTRTRLAMQVKSTTTKRAADFLGLKNGGF